MARYDAVEVARALDAVDGHRKRTLNVPETFMYITNTPPGSGTGSIEFSVAPFGDGLIVVFQTDVIDTHALRQAASYSLTGTPDVSVIEVTRTGPRAVLLALSTKLRSGISYTLNIAPDTTWKTGTFEPLDPLSVTFNAAVYPMPSFASVRSIAQRKVEITFTLPVSRASAENVGNYNINSPLVEVESVTVVDDKTVILTTVTDLEDGTSYQLFVSLLDQYGTAFSDDTMFSGFDPSTVGTLVTSVRLLGAGIVKLTFSQGILVNSRLFEPGNYAFSVRFGYAKSAYVRTVETATPFGQLTTSVTLYLYDYLSQNGRYALRLTNLTDSLGNIVNTPEFNFGA